METLNPLTPNTAAFLDSLAFGDIDTKTPNPTAFPPSAFFPVPGRDTPEESSPDSILDAADGKQGRNQSFNLSDDSETEMTTGAAAQNKRKAQASKQNAEDNDDEDESFSENDGHEDKRQHGNDKSGRGRRNTLEKKGNDKGPKDTTTKAQRRKEQNRAAQKAFRERREAKVRDLEAKVAELEAKSFGASVENENLRGILRRLQEENVALKQAAFTFSVPFNGNSSTSNNNSTTTTTASAATTTQRSGQQTPTAAALNQQPSGIDWSQFANFKVQQIAKPPSPPQSVSNDSLRSIHEASPHFAHRQSTSSVPGASPESLVSINGPSPSSGSERNAAPSLFSGNASVQPQLSRSPNTQSPADNLSTPSSIGGTNKEDVEALFRSLYPNGIDSILASANNNGTTQAANTTTTAQPVQSVQSQYTFLSSQPGLTSAADSNNLAKMFGDATSYRDSSAVPSNPLAGLNSLNASTTSNASTTTNVIPASNPLANQAQWADLTENSVSDFLASLSGANATSDSADVLGGADDDAFSKQLEALIAQSGGTSPSAPFVFPGTTFSPNAYLNMSPSPLQSLSNSQTPRSTTGESASASASPSSDAAAAFASSTGAPVCGTSKVIHVLGEDGRVMRPSEVWTKMGMHTTEPGDFLIDDLCDQMKSKATCKDGRRYMKFDDVKTMVAARASGVDCDDEPSPHAKTEYADPAESQARLNEAYIQANGGL
ncbi:DNA-binding transcription factor yap1 [Vanrija albida]|uniref:DNA-binding transcription factor yap1 n=1 Tax=Vanrija albida TaxID=181172 RepID=A0ABR3QFL8_9TREE